MTGIFTRALISVVRFYQAGISPWKGGISCRFYPSCSAYAAEALNRHGVLRGLALTFKRLVRCHPLSPGGYDPVP